MKTVTYDLPVHWAQALFYGDMDGFEDEDQKAIEKFTNYMVLQHGECNAMDVSEDCWFAKYHDAADFGVLACDVSTYTFSEV